MNIQEIKQKYPQYAAMPDAELAERLYNKSYTDKMSFEDFSVKVGIAKYDNEDVPTPENLAIEPEQKPEPSLIDKAIGAGEAALTMATGATGGAIGYLASAPDAALNEIRGIEGQGLDNAQDMAANLTYQPRTEEGKQMAGSVAKVLGVLPPILGTAPINTIATLNPLIAGKQITAKLLKTPRSRRALLVEQIKQGNPNIDLVTKAIDSSGKIITRKSSVNALKAFGGDDAAKRTVSLLENLNEATRKQVAKMADVIERGNKNALFKNENRPSDILGKSILDRARAVTTLNKDAGKNIGNIAKSLDNTTVDIAAPSGQFFNKLNELGVTFKRGDDGWVQPDFSRSKFVGGSQKDMTVLVNDLMNNTPDFNTAHKLKQMIRDNVNYDKGGTGQLSAASERILSDLSRGIDDVLDSTSTKYKAANERFAKTVALKNDFDKLAGKDIDISSDFAAKSLGSKGMRLVSNAESRVAIQQTLSKAESTLKEMGVRFKDDLPSLIHITSDLNNMFKLAPDGSLKGNIISGGLQVAETISSPIAAVRQAAAKYDQLKAPDFNKRMTALKAVLNEGKK